MFNTDFSAQQGSIRENAGAARCAAALVWLLFVIGIALSPIGDFLSVRALRDGSEGSISLLIRGGMVAGFVVVLMLGGRIRERSGYIAILVAVAVLMSGLMYAQGEVLGAELGKQIIFIFKVFSFFACYAALSGLSEKRLQRLEPLVHVVLITYAMAILLGAAFSIDMFRSYQADTQIRSGYKGIIYAQNEASALLMVGLAYGYLRVLRSGWRVVDGVLIGCMIGAAMLLGTKGAVVGSLGVTCAYFYARHNALQATQRTLCVVAAMAGIAWLAYLTVPSIQQATDLSLRYFSYHHDHADGNALLTILLSGRNVKFANVWDDLSRQGYAALLTGGYPVVRYAVEIDAPDLILALGLPVFALYIWAFAGRFIYRGRASTVRFGKLFFIVLMGVACTAGHVLVSALISPYLALIAVTIQRSTMHMKPSELPTEHRGRDGAKPSAVKV